ncbi:MAG: helix-turn-helix domain-containing protein [Hungatella sp.]|nr:helix-turn-helix domain-containing protein [Hungatella sp.]
MRLRFCADFIYNKGLAMRKEAYVNGANHYLTLSHLR